MFDKLIELPTADTQHRPAERMLRPLVTTLNELHSDGVYTDYYTHYDVVTAYLHASLYIDAMNCQDEKMKSMVASWTHDTNNFTYIYKDDFYENKLGIVINIDTEPKWNEFIDAELENKTELSGAAEALKLSTRHFLKIFHRPDNPNLLFIYSNKELPLETVLKLKLLQNRINKDNLEKFVDYTEKLYNAFLAGSVDAVNAIIDEYGHSDYILEKNHRDFIKTMSASARYKEEDLKNSIKSAYRNIANYENAISDNATKIKKWNLELMALKNGEETEEEIEMLFKYLTKHPYIKEFITKANENAIDLKFYAPLLYYTDYAIEKLQKHYQKDEIDYKIYDLFLKRRFQLYTKCTIRFWPENFRIESMYRGQSDPEILGHPHIDQYNCFGNHREGLQESAEMHDYIGGIEQISQAALNMNFYDACVTEHLIGVLENDYYDNKRHTWLDTKTGEMVTTTEAIRRSDDEKA